MSQKANRLHRGTTVVDGHGHFAITAVGDGTEIGKTLRESIVDFKHETPLKQQLAKLSKVIGVVGFGVATVTFFALVARGLLVGTMPLRPGEWYFYAAVFAGLAIILAPVWLALIGGCTELDWVRNPTRHRDCENFPGRGLFALGFVLMGILLGVGIALGILSPQPDDWTTAENARLLLRDFMIAVTDHRRGGARRTGHERHAQPGLQHAENDGEQHARPANGRLRNDRRRDRDLFR